MCVAGTEYFVNVLFNGQFIINLSSDCTATTYRSFFFVRKSPNIYDNAESVIGGYLLDRDTVRRADTKQSTVDNRYICVMGLDYSP